MTLQSVPAFKSFMMAGFECSAHRRKDGQRLDLIDATQHDRYARADYEQLGRYGISTVRDGVRWHLIEATRGDRNWASLDPMLTAAKQTGTQVIWDLLHYGWPDWANPFDADFVECFADFAGDAARRIGPGGYYCPINEISFLAWGGGEVGYLNPFMTERGEELKHQLCKAAIAAIRRIRAVDPTSVMISCEPLIAVHAARAAHEPAAAAHNAAQYHAVDCLLGRRNPEFGGDEAYIDIVGLNYYPYNQWFAAPSELQMDPAQMLPLRILLMNAARHFNRPIFIAETGREDDLRAPWLTMVLREVDAASDVGHAILGVCLYPILDHPGWDDDRVCRNGLMCGYSDPPRPVHEPLLEVVLGRSRTTYL